MKVVSVLDGGERTHQGAEHCASKNSAPFSLTTRRSSDRASMSSSAARGRSIKPARAAKRDASPAERARTAAARQKRNGARPHHRDSINDSQE